MYNGMGDPSSNGGFGTRAHCCRYNRAVKIKIFEEKASKLREHPI